MNCQHCTEKLHDYVDAALPPADRAAVESHLAACPACRAEFASLTSLRTATAQLPRALAPARDLWPEIAAQLSAPPHSVSPPNVIPYPSPTTAAPTPFRLPRSPFRILLPLATAASIALLSLFFNPQSAIANRQSTWSVAPLAGAPQIATVPITTDSPFRLGQWLETDATSRARVAVGSIGEVNVAPNSRLRLAGTAARDHRLELTRGKMDALIWAPPRLFFVDTPSATAVDLGCAYTLEVDAHGHSELWDPLESTCRHASLSIL